MDDDIKRLEAHIVRQEASLLALNAQMSLQEKLHDTFLRTLVTHICLSDDTFDAELLLSDLYLHQSTFPSPDTSDPKTPTSREEIALKMWKRKIDLVEQAVENAQRIREG